MLRLSPSSEANSLMLMPLLMSATFTLRANSACDSVRLVIVFERCICTQFTHCANAVNKIFTQMQNISHTLRELRCTLKLTQTEMAEEMGLSLSYIHQLESGKRTPSANVERLVRMMSEKHAAGFKVGELQEDESDYKIPDKKCRMVPLIGMAHAGEVINYEEIERQSRDFVPTLCKDEEAFAVGIEGDSMFPKIKDRDVVILSPALRPHNGCIVIARIHNEGVVCRSVERSGGKVLLIPANERYSSNEYEEALFDWMYVVYGTWTQFWRD